MKRIKRIGVFTTAKFFAALYAFIGFIGGIIFTAIALLTQSGDHPAPWFLNLAVVLFPILYGILGLVAGTILSVIYNTVAKMMGGIEIEIE